MTIFLIKVSMQNNITSREKEVLKLLSDDHTYRDVAKKLFISVDTVKSHRCNLGTKLSVKTLGGLVRKGFELGLLEVAV